MRIIRAMTTALAFGAVLPAAVAAQSSRPFDNAWFWGVKGGGFGYSSLGTSNAQVPIAGIDWLITRTHGGLYVAFSQAFLDDITFIGPVAPGDTAFHPVALKNMRRLEVAAMIFPGSNKRFQPYAGLGFTINQVNSALSTEDPNALSPDEQAGLEATIINYRTGASPLIIAGAQLRLPMISAFIQGTASPAQKNFFLYANQAFNVSYEVGLRYNIGSSIAGEW